MINYHKENLIESKLMSVKDLADLLNKKFPKGKVDDANPRRSEKFAKSEMSSFTLSDVLNYTSRGAVPPKYLRANIFRVTKENIKVDFYEEI